MTIRTNDVTATRQKLSKPLDAYTIETGVVCLLDSDNLAHGRGKIVRIDGDIVELEIEMFAAGERFWMRGSVIVDAVAA